MKRMGRFLSVAGCGGLLMAGCSGGAAMPLIVVLHGGGGTGHQTDSIMHFTPIADREGVILAFPDGIGRTWNDGRDDAISLSARQSIDDVGFINAMVDEIGKALPVD